MQNCIFNPSEFESEIEVIIQERRMRSESQANGIIREVLNSMVFFSHPNRDPIIGWPSDLRKVTRDQAYQYYKTYYTPNNAFMVLVGDFETDHIVKLVNKYYGKISKGSDVKEIWAVQEPQTVRKTFTLNHSDITQPQIRLVFVVPAYSDSDAAALKVAGLILCEKSRDARLYKRMVENDQIVTSVAGGFGLTKDPSIFQISATLKPDSSVDKVEKIIWEEITRMQKELVIDHELQKTKNRYKFNQVTNYVKNADIGTRMSRYEAYFNWEFQKEFDERVLSVTKDDIITVMKKYFTDEKVMVAYAYPKAGSEKSKKSNAEDVEQNDNTETNYNSDEDVFYFMPPSETLQISHSYIHGEYDDIILPKPVAPMIKTMKLKNGITFHTIENHLVPTISIVGSIETGFIPENLEGEKPGIASYLTDVMSRGTENMTYEQLSERMAFVPFSFSTSGSYKGFFFQGNSLLEDADEMMKAGYDMVINPPLRKEDIEKIRPRHSIAAKNRFKRTGIKAFYEMFNTIFEGHPLTKYNSTEESIKKITRDDLVNLHQKYFQPDKTILLMIGDMTPEQMKELAEKYFGDWAVDGSSFDVPVTPPVKELNKKVIKVFPEKDYTECTINIGFAPTNNVESDEEEAIAVMNYILASSALTSRMGIELRDKQGLIYGIKSELWSTSDKIGYWKFNTKTAPQNTEKVISGIFSEIKKLFETGITDGELNAAKQRQLGLLPFRVETPDDVAQIVFDSLREKEPFDYFDKKADRIKAVTKDDVIKVAKKYFTLDRFVISVDGPIEANSLDNLLTEL
jgi:zinc protease